MEPKHCGGTWRNAIYLDKGKARAADKIEEGTCYFEFGAPCNQPPQPTPFRSYCKPESVPGSV